MAEIGESGVNFNTPMPDLLDRPWDCGCTVTRIEEGKVCVSVKTITMGIMHMEV